MAKAAESAGLVGIDTRETAVDVGVTEPGQLVAYRFGQAQFSTWLASLPQDRREQARTVAVEAVTPIMEPYRPIVVILAARVP